ncbi:breast cancer anti-estrogen resistance protein 1-like [Eleutherodactylus coqui]|uniref:breast cancer anti-estrogen resistance protein 1-like n=1 Tax=Eleutherodactylus coqui TaxID=57060 RepID=UPI003462D0BA
MGLSEATLPARTPRKASVLKNTHPDCIILSVSFIQGKEEFEKTQKELLEKGNIIRQGKGHLEQQQLKQFERLEEEVARPIENDLSNWTPPQHYSQVRSTLSNSDRQLLLFYQEQCEANVTTLTNAIDAFYSSISSNQPSKIFVAHSKFVILSIYMGHIVTPSQSSGHPKQSHPLQQSYV